MKSIIAGVLMSFFYFSAHAGMESLKPVLIDIDPDQVYSPQGFDDNDNAQIVIDGNLPNTCYRIGPTTFKIDEQKKTITVKQTAYYYSSSWCPQIPVAYTQTVDLGILSEGNYAIVLETTDQKLKQMSLLPIGVSSSSSPDENLYAPINSVRLEKTMIEKKGIESDFFYNLQMDGITTTNCMSLKNTLMLVRPNQVIEILPIMDLSEKNSFGENCDSVKREFNISVSLKQIQHGRYLLHIRSLNGKSYNIVADL